MPHGSDAGERSPFVRRLIDLSRRTKRAVMVSADALCIPLVMWAAILLKTGDWVPLTEVAPAAAAAVLASVPVFARLGLYRAVVRFMGPLAARAVAFGVFGSVAILLALGATGVLELARTTVIIYGALLLVYVGASRMLLRWVLLQRRGLRAGVVIYGAGDAGVGLASALTNSAQFAPVAFVDDNPSLVGTVLGGIEVYPTAELPRILREYGVRKVLMAMPHVTRDRRREILTTLEPLGVHVQTIPSVSAMVSGTARAEDVQEVDAADLLWRDAVPPNQQLLDACIRGKVVMVTGAGGSIGSELCRQIVRLAPTRLLLLEMSELALYNIDRELRRLAQVERLTVDIVPLLGNAHHKYRVREILQTFGVQTLYHAAAYKHVPIVEQNIIEGIHNNIISTWHTAEAALECKVETFVLISTDKAVNPTNVMGATKRFAEIVLQGLQQRTESTRYCMVRFGNVLESSGSVVPLFREQIRRGGPVTVTHPDVMRYFMTIPEASQLVLQAGSMAKGGDVFVLDMGKPIRILDLARRMIQLSGYTVRDDSNPTGDIAISFTGLRPAEKMFEELLIGKNVTGTDHPMIMRAVEHALPWEAALELLEELGLAMRRFDCKLASEILTRAVQEYVPTQMVADIVWRERMRAVSSVASGDPKVTDLHSRRNRPPQS